MASCFSTFTQGRRMTEQGWMSLSEPFQLMKQLGLVAQPRKLFLLAPALLRRVWSALPGDVNRDGVEAVERFARGRIGLRELLEVWSRAEEETAEELWIHPGRPLDWDAWANME